MSRIKITKQIRELLSNPQLSSNARVLYLLICDRIDLSEKNKETFSDEHGIFIYFTVAEVQKVLCCAVATAVKVLGELEQNNLIVRRHTQKADKIYLSHIPKIETCAFQKLESMHSTNYNPHISKIETNQKSMEQKPKNQEIKSSSSSTPPQKISDEQIKNQVDYDRLIDNDPANIPLYNMMVDILANDDGIYNKDIGYEHLHSLADTIKGKKDIVHIRAYLRTCLKNIVVDFAIKNQKNEKPKKYKDKYEKDWETLKRVSSDPSYTWLD